MLESTRVDLTTGLLVLTRNGGNNELFQGFMLFLGALGKGLANKK